MLDDCVKLSKTISEHIEEAQILDYNFNMEVSSAGLDRKFVRIEDFKRCIGKRIETSCNKLINGEKEFRGKITAARGEQVTIT